MDDSPNPPLPNFSATYMVDNHAYSYNKVRLYNHPNDWSHFHSLKKHIHKAFAIYIVDISLMTPFSYAPRSNIKILWTYIKYQRRNYCSVAHYHM